MDGPYTFPTHRLGQLPAGSDKTPLVLVACGSYSPVTFLHLRLFEMARDDATFNTQFQVIGGYLSPVNDRYRKLGLASAPHRVAMCELAVNDTSEWLMVDPWEARQPRYLPTAQVLDHFDHELNTVRGGAEVVVGTDPHTGAPIIEKRRVRIMLLAGSDLILTMSEPGVWAEKDLHHILGIYGLYIIERAESELDQTLFSSSSVHSRSPLALYRQRIRMVEQTVRNDVSSTKVRLFIRKGMSVKYLIPTVVIRYITRHGLYRTADRRRSSLAQVAPPEPSLRTDAGGGGRDGHSGREAGSSSSGASATADSERGIPSSAARASAPAGPQGTEQEQEQGPAADRIQAERERAKAREDERGRRDLSAGVSPGAGADSGPTVAAAGEENDAEMACA